MKGYYILEGHTPKEVDNIMEWSEWFEKAERHVNKTEIGNVLISTIFLGLDHAYNGEQPLLFETMIFGGEHDEFQERYSTWEEAEAGHQRAINLIK